MLINKVASKTCQLDRSFPLKLLDVLLPVITKLINPFFDTGRFTETWKEARVLPSLKKPDLDFAFSNSLLIHWPKTKEITTVKEVWICGLN